MRATLLVGFMSGALGVAVDAPAQPLRGRVEARSVQAPGGHAVAFNVYLPEGYDGSTQRYPVIYHLHGLGGGPASSNLSVPRSFETAQTAGTIGPVIVVFPDSYEDAWWADSVNSPKPAESDVLGVLMPHVDATLRTIPTPGARAVQGFSMGGFGATKFYSKFPGLFAACVEYDGAFMQWNVFSFLFPGTADEIFDDSQTVYNQFSPWHWSSVNAAALRTLPPMRMVVGALQSQNRSFRNHLQALQVPVNYVETTCGHDLDCLLAAQGQVTASFIASHLDLTCPPSVCGGCDSIDFNGDGLFPDNQDLQDFLSVFGGGQCPTGSCADIDFNNDGLFPDNEDVETYLRVFGGGDC
ncbi:MAG TPA: alpha/beta hydrolase-fold protein [Phycisphaerales bacterium]|nr:alpha/beta hydrolase-fold protein [Phycisphaerales bacterium]